MQIERAALHTAANILERELERRAGGKLVTYFPTKGPPGHPEQNGRHERMHLTLKTEATKAAAANALQQQARFDV